MRIGLAACAAVLAWAGVARAAPPPASAFGRIPAVGDVAISKNGQHIAIMRNAQDQQFLAIATVDSAEMPLFPLGKVEGLAVRWAGDDYVVATVGLRDTLPDKRRSYYFEQHVAVSLDGKSISKLMWRGASAGRRFVTRQPILGVSDSSDILLVGLTENGGANATLDTRIQRKGDGGATRALWRVDPSSGEARLEERGNFDTVSWTVDSTGAARVRIDVDEVRHTTSLYGRPKGTGQWTAILTNADRYDGPFYLGYLEPADAILLEIDGKVVQHDLASGTETPFDRRDDEQFIWDNDTGSVVGLRSEAEQPSIRWLDPDIGSIYETLSRAFKGRRVTFWDWSRDRTRFIVRVSGPTSPPTWYLYDKPRKEASLLGEDYPELAGANLSPMVSRPYKARDGLEIPAYLTLPTEAAASGRKPPLVILPHDGPHRRDIYGFDYMAAFLASRGYAVLQPQFRGSFGFGKAFLDAGEGEWGGKIQTDLLDGVAALAASGEVDASKVCIIGTGFGGYSALAGATLHPEAYACAAAIGGYSDLGKLMSDQVRLYAPETPAVADMQKELGGSAMIEAWSPSHHASAVRAPVLLIHGDEDTDVGIYHSEEMADALGAAGKTYEFIRLEQEDHYLTKAANRTKALEALGAFLAKNLPLN